MMDPTRFLSRLGKFAFIPLGPMLLLGVALSRRQRSPRAGFAIRLRRDCGASLV